MKILSGHARLQGGHILSGHGLTSENLGPEIENVFIDSSGLADNGNGTYTLTSAGGSEYVRVLYDVADLDDGATYKVIFQITAISLTAGAVTSDLCDVEVFTFDATGTKSYYSSRPTYDATYRFVDIDFNGSVSPGDTVTFTAPMLRKVL